MPRTKQPTPEAKKAEDAERQIKAAVGNTNQEQIDKRNAIADRADEYRSAELEETDGERAWAPDPEEAKAEREAQEAEAERARLENEAREAEAQALQAGAEPGPRTYRVKVNGRDVEMSEAELIARASKVASADEYLQTAKNAVERVQASAPSQQDVPATDGDAISEEVVASAIQGDREAIQKIAQRLNGPSVSRDVLQAVDARLTFRDAVNWFNGEYKDVVGDPFLYRLVVEEDKKIAETEPSLPYRERLKRAGDTIRTWKSGFSKTPTVNPKLERKAATPPVPSAGSRQAPPKDDEENETVENVIEAMAKARGQTTAIRTPQGMFGERKQ